MDGTEVFEADIEDRVVWIEDLPAFDSMNPILRTIYFDTYIDEQNKMQDRMEEKEKGFSSRGMTDEQKLDELFKRKGKK